MAGSQAPAGGGKGQGWVKTLIWAVVALVAIFAFREPLGRLIDRVTGVKIDKGGVSIEAAAQALAAAVTDRTGETAGAVPDTVGIREFVRRTASDVSPTALSEAHVLWVDENPGGNANERKALEALGIAITTVPSTDSAVSALAQGHYTIVISDFKRPADDTAGYTLLNRVRRLSPATPFVIYSSTATPEQVDSARLRGALGQTNQPRQLFDMVVGGIKRPQTTP